MTLNIPPNTVLTDSRNINYSQFDDPSLTSSSQNPLNSNLDKTQISHNISLPSNILNGLLGPQINPNSEIVIPAATTQIQPTVYTQVKLADTQDNSQPFDPNIQNKSKFDIFDSVN